MNRESLKAAIDQLVKAEIAVIEARAKIDIIMNSEQTQTMNSLFEPYLPSPNDTESPIVNPKRIRSVNRDTESDKKSFPTKILELLNGSPAKMFLLPEIKAAVGSTSPTAVNGYLNDLVNNQEVVRVSRGVYRSRHVAA